MIPIVAACFLIAAALFLLVFWRRRADPARAEELREAFDRAAAGESSAVMRAMVSLARPISALPQVRLREDTNVYRALRRKIVGSGGTFGGSVEVFLSMQVLSCLVAAAGVGAAIIAGVSGGGMAGCLLAAAAFCALPYNRLSSAFKKRAAEVATGLPEFAELLLMPVSSGFGVLPALDFTAKHLEGPVAAEVRSLLAMLAGKVSSEKQAFTDAAERLGSSEAATFFNTLYQSYVEGVKVADSIRGQAEQLRKKAYEATRARLKTLPNKLVIIMGIHLMPFLFAVVLLPTFSALAAL